jgi:hypothetical protein
VAHTGTLDPGHVSRLWIGAASHSPAVAQTELRSFQSRSYARRMLSERVFTM